jgi:hypothetical protein
MARGGRGLPKAGVHNLLFTMSYFFIFEPMRIYQSKYETVFTASTVLYLLYCIYCAVLIVLYLLYYTYCTVLIVLYCIYCTCLYSIHNPTVIAAQYNIFVFPKAKQGAKYAYFEPNFKRP